MNAELLSLIPTTEQRAKMASVYIRQSSFMQVTLRVPNSSTRWWSELSNWDGLVNAWKSLMRIWANLEPTPLCVAASSTYSPR